MLKYNDEITTNTTNIFNSYAVNEKSTEIKVKYLILRIMKYKYQIQL